MDRIVLITGGSRGIGRATARVLAKQGYDIAVNYVRDAEAAAAVVAEIEAEGRRAIAVQADTSDPDAVRTMFAAVDTELGTLTHLVNNAGVILERGRFGDLSDETIERMLAVNINSHVYCTREAIRRMSTLHGGKGGVICNVASGAALNGQPHSSVLYAMTKGALVTMSVGLSIELAQEGIRVNAVSPGLIATEMPGPAIVAEREVGLPMKRAGTAEEIAHGIAYLLSDEASYTTGANLRITGGML